MENPAKFFQYDSQIPQTITVWWSVKVICGLLLVVNQAFYHTFAVPRPMIAFPVLLSQLMVITGASIFFMHFYILRKAGPVLSHPVRLVKNKGLFPWIRHPMYMGEMILDIGLASFCINPASIIILVAALFSLFRQALHEDHILATRFGVLFSEWRRMTGLLFPAKHG